MRMITASKAILDDRKIVGNASFEDVLKAVQPKEVYCDEEEESETCAPTAIEPAKDMPSESPTSEAGRAGMPAVVAAEMENLLEQRSIQDSPAQSERPEEQREPDPRSEFSPRRSSCI